MDCPHCQSLFSDGAEDRLDESQRRQFIEHLRGCAACETAWGGYRRSLWAMQKLPAAALPMGFHDRLHARLAEAVRQPAPGPWWQRAPRVAYASAAVVLLAAGGLWVAGHLSTQNHGSITPAASTLAAPSVDMPIRVTGPSLQSRDATRVEAPPRPNGAKPERAGEGALVRADHVSLRVDEQARSVIVKVDAASPSAATIAVHGLQIASSDLIQPGHEVHYPFPAAAGERPYAQFPIAQFHLFVGGLAPHPVIPSNWSFHGTSLAKAVEQLDEALDIAVLIEGPVETKVDFSSGRASGGLDRRLHAAFMLNSLLIHEGYETTRSGKAWVAIKK